jgi:hypothetical protein
MIIGMMGGRRALYAAAMIMMFPKFLRGTLMIHDNTQK